MVMTRDAHLPLERLIASAWKDVLRIRSVREDDNFFDLGGHSLLIVRVQSKLRDAGFELPLVELFRYPTPRVLAEAIIRGEIRTMQGLQAAAKPVSLTAARRDQAKAVHRIEAVFSIVSLLVPARVANEEIGDGLESLHNLALTGGAPWRVYLKGTSTTFWILLNALREVTGALLGRVRQGG